MDPESNQRRPNSSVNNPYAAGPEPNVLPTWHPINVLRRCFYMGISLYGLHHFRAYQTIMKSPNVSHEWFKIGLASTVAILFLKAYVELYSGRLQKKEVKYDNFKQETHIVLILILWTSLSFHIALWGEYGSTSMVIMFLLGMFILNFCLLMPTSVQNVVAFGLITFFLQEYK